MKSCLSILLLLAIPVVATAQGVITDSFSGVTRIELSTGSGDAVFVKGGGSTVDLHLEYTYSDNSFKPRFVQNGSTLVMSEEFTGRNNRGRSTWTLTVPDGLDVRFSTGSGDFEASNLSMNLSTTLGSGDVSLSYVTGDVKFTAGSGDLDLFTYNGTLRSTTGSGDVTARDVDGDITITTGSGDVDIRGANGSLNATTGSGDVSALDFVSYGDVKLTTGSGDILVSLAGELKGDLTLSAGSGSSELRRNGHELTGELVMRAGERNGRIDAPFEFDSTEIIRNGGSRTRENIKVFGSSNQRVVIQTGSGSAIIR